MDSEHASRIWVPLLFIAAMFACILLLSVSADESCAGGKCGPDLYWDMDGSGNLTFTGWGMMDTVGDWSGCVTVTMPGDLTEVMDEAFRGCGNLTTVTINNSEVYIGKSAFRECPNLTTVTMAGAFFIDEYAFQDCPKLTAVNVAGSIAGIEPYAFSECTLLTSFNVAGAIESIGTRAFSYCINLTSMTINGPVVMLQDDVFSGCASLEEVTINGTVSQIWHDFFCACDALREVTFTGHVEIIDAGVFNDCPNLQSVNVICTDVQHFEDSGCVPTSAQLVAVHNFSSTYAWADDGHSCTVHIVCGNDASHNHDDSPEVTSAVKIPPTETEMGTTEYSVSGTYLGYQYQSAKDVQDIPAIGPQDPEESGEKGSVWPYVMIGIVVVLAVAGIVAFVLLRRHR